MLWIADEHLASTVVFLLLALGIKVIDGGFEFARTHISVRILNGLREDYDIEIILSGERISELVGQFPVGCALGRLDVEVSSLGNAVGIERVCVIDANIIGDDVPVLLGFILILDEVSLLRSEWPFVIIVDETIAAGLLSLCRTEDTVALEWLVL